jgi:hypothetical protein
LEEEKAAKCRARVGFGRFLAAKIEFFYRTGQTVNLLALGLQWFESTPTQASPRAILQVMAQLARAGINIIIKPQNQTRLPAVMFHRTTFLFRGCSSGKIIPSFEPVSSPDTRQIGFQIKPDNGLHGGFLDR